MNKSKDILFSLPLLILISIIFGITSFNFLINELQCEIIENRPVQKKIIVNNGEKTYTLEPKSFYVGQDSLNMKWHKNYSELELKSYLNFHPKIIRWILFHSIAVSIMIMVAFYILGLIRKLFNKFELDLSIINKSKFILVFIVTLGIILFIVWKIHSSQGRLLSGTDIMNEFEIIFQNPESATNFILIPLIFISVIFLVGIGVINLCTYKTFNHLEFPINIDALDDKAELANDFHFIKENLNIFIFLSGLIISIAIIGTGLQRDMIINEISNGALLYPEEFVYAYGAFCSIILGLFFSPSVFYLNYYKVINSDKKEKMKIGYWTLSKESIEMIKVALAISLPIISSIIQPLII